MVHLDTLPSDSVLRRHALGERNRILGLPPTDAVLRRHYAQLQAALSERAQLPQAQAAAEAARPGSAPSVSVPQHAAAVAPKLAAGPAAPLAPATPAAPAKAEAGLFAWLRRMLGAS